MGLRVFLDSTLVGFTFGGTTGTATLNFLQLYWSDIQYANTHAATVPVAETGGTNSLMSFQGQLDLASQKLLSMSEPAPQITAVANTESGSHTIAPNTWLEVDGANLAPALANLWPGFL